METAVGNWSRIFYLKLDASAVGRQSLSDPFQSHQIMATVLGTEFPHMAPINDIAQILPFSEHVCWRYVQFLNQAKISASRASSFVQGVRFAHYVFNVDGALEASSSRRIGGLADIQLAGKSEASKQARALTVSEVKRLHDLAASSERHAIDRCIVSHLLLML